MIRKLVYRMLVVVGFAYAAMPCDTVIIGTTGDPSSCGGTTGVPCP